MSCYVMLSHVTVSRPQMSCYTMLSHVAVTRLLMSIDISGSRWSTDDKMPASLD